MSKRQSGENLGTVDRVVEIISFFAARGEATLKDMSNALSLAPSTSHRLLDLLIQRGVIEQDSARRRYRIGRELVRIAALVHSRSDSRTIARPFLRSLVDQCNETCVLGLYLPAEGKMYFAEKIDSSRLLRYELPMNTPVSVLWGASGRSILAFLDKEDVDRIYQSEGRAPGSGEALPSRRALEKLLEKVRDRGYDITCGQKIVGAVGIAAPVFGPDDRVIGNLSATVPESRISVRDRPQLAELVRATAAQLSAALGSRRHDIAGAAE